MRNTGERPVRETVQLYLRRLSGGSAWPRVRELPGFARLDLRPGEEAEAVFAIDADTLASVTRDLGLAVEPGELMLETGPSSAETQAARLVVDGSGPEAGFGPGRTRHFERAVLQSPARQGSPGR